MVLAPPALVILEAAARAKQPLTRRQAADANDSGETTADDYLRALARLGFLERVSVGRGIGYQLTASGQALAERRPFSAGQRRPLARRRG